MRIEHRNQKNVLNLNKEILELNKERTNKPELLNKEENHRESIRNVSKLSISKYSDEDSKETEEEKDESIKRYVSKL